MFIRLKAIAGNEINVNSAQILTFVPSEGGEGSEVSLSDNTQVLVVESCRTIRHLIKKAASVSSEQAEA